jgi:hypothetical protein
LSTFTIWIVYDGSSVPVVSGEKLICEPPVMLVSVDVPNAAARMTPAPFDSSSIFVVSDPCPSGRNRRDARYPRRPPDVMPLPCRGRGPRSS